MGSCSVIVQTWAVLVGGGGRAWRRLFESALCLIDIDARGIDNLTVRIAQIQGSSHRYRWSQYSITFRGCYRPQAPREMRCRIYFSGVFYFLWSNTVGYDTFAYALQGELGTKIPQKTTVWE